MEEEAWLEYDSKDRLVYTRNSEGWESWREYDSVGNVIHFKSSIGGKVQEEYWKSYDSKGNETRLKDSDGIEYLWKYDEAGNCLWENRNGEEIFYEYDIYPDGKVRIRREYTSEI